MKVCWFGFLGRNHSWSIVAQNLCRELIAMGHDVDMFSTNGTSNFPEDLKPYLKGSLDNNDLKLETLADFQKKIGASLDVNYDAQLSYTALLNFNHYFLRGNKNRFGIWNYETTVLPKAFAKYYKSVDKVLPSSNFSKKIFTDNGMPESHQVVIPHGVDPTRYTVKERYPLRTKKKYKILVNIAQPHLRKNIPGMLEAYGKAFDKNDDVCLVLKISRKGQKNPSTVSFDDIYAKFKKTYKNHADIEIIDHFLVDIEPLYLACDIVFTMTHAECFWMPGLEGFAANKIVVAPNYGGQLDYMNNTNSVLIGGKEIRADVRMQYWEPSIYAKVFQPDVDEAARALRDVVKNYDDYHKSFSPNMQQIVEEYTWRKAAQKIVDLCV